MYVCSHACVHISIFKDTRVGFDIVIGGSDSAEAINLLGLYLLYKVKEEIPNLTGGLYMEDDLFLTKKKNPKQLEILKKENTLIL